MGRVVIDESGMRAGVVVTMVTDEVVVTGGLGIAPVVVFTGDSAYLLRVWAHLSVLMRAWVQKLWAQWFLVGHVEMMRLEALWSMLEQTLVVSVGELGCCFVFCLSRFFLKRQ